MSHSNATQQATEKQEKRQKKKSILEDMLETSTCINIEDQKVIGASNGHNDDATQLTSPPLCNGDDVSATTQKSSSNYGSHNFMT